MSPEADSPSLLGRLAGVIGSAIGQRAEMTGILLRREIYRGASIVALLLFALVCACGAIGFAAIAVLTALGVEHRVLGASLIAGILALASGLGIYRARAAIAPRPRGFGER